MKAKIQYTIREIPPTTDIALRKKAKALGKSLNTVTLEALQAAAGIEVKKTANHDLDFIAGTWIEDAKIDKALTEERKTHKGDW
jgi:hypothetical protein